MADCTIILARMLFICCFLMVHCTQPNCTSVTDFGNCLGNTTNFCPNDIACACKDEKPFCKCQNFRGQWGDYWYMGEKCEQLWNTLDLILVATLPGITLALIVGVVIQIIHYCKGKPKKNEDHHREERNMPELRPAIILHMVLILTGIFLSLIKARLNDLYKCEMKHGKNNDIKQLGRESLESNLPGTLFWKFFSPSSQLSRTNSNYFAQECKEGILYNYPAPNWNGSPGSTKPAVNYGNNFLPTTPMRPSFDFSTSGPQRATYIPKEKSYSAYVEPEIPYKIGRAHMKSNY